MKLSIRNLLLGALVCAGAAGCDVPASNSSNSTGEPDLYDMLKAGKAEACSSQTVKDNIISMAFPEKPDDIPASSWESMTSHIQLTVTKTNVVAIDADTSRISCSAAISVDDGEQTKEFAAPYTLVPDLDDPGGVLINSDFSDATAYMLSLTNPRVAGWREVNSHLYENEADNAAMSDDASNAEGNMQMNAGVP